MADTTSKGISLSKRILAAVLSVFERPAYYFFRDQVWYPMPVPIHSVNVKASTSATVDWVYYPDSKEFLRYPVDAGEEGTTKKRAPFLSLEVVGTDDRVMFDLTDFMEGIWIINDEQYPRQFTLWHIVQAWTLSSGIIPDVHRMKEFRVITDSGDVQILSLANDSLHDIFAGEADDTEPPTAETREARVLAQLREEERRTAERNDARRAEASAARMESVD